MTSETPSAIFSSYSTPQRRYYPPSDIESELEAETSFINSSGENGSSPAAISTSSTNSETKKLNKLLSIYKNKYTQLKNAYDEVEAEKEKIKVFGFLVFEFVMNSILIRFGTKENSNGQPRSRP